MVPIGSEGVREVQDVMLRRYACCPFALSSLDLFVSADKEMVQSLSLSI
jgi:hypothetical protein